MKTKKFFMLLAAVLLMSASAMAQSSEPVRGDLNGDGKVGMPDIMYLVQKVLTGSFPDEGEKTYYWYVGTDQPTAVDNPSAWRTSNSDAGFSGSMNNYSDGTIFYVAYPDSWTLEITDKDDYTVEKNYLSQSVTNSISGYKLNKFTSDGETSTWKLNFTK